MATASSLDSPGMVGAGWSPELRARAHGTGRAGSTVIVGALALIVACLLVAGQARADQEACLHAHEQGQVERLRSHFLEAREQFIACAQAACPGAVRADCKQWLGEVESSLPSLVFAVSDERGRDLVDARVSTETGVLSERADGRALSINPGVYALRIEADGYASEQQQLSVREGEKRRLVRVVLRASGAANDATADARPGEPASESESAQQKRARRLLLSSYVLGGLGVVGLATGIPLGVIGKNELDDLRARGCAPDCPRSEVRSGRRKYLLANVSFAAAGALLGAAVFTFVWGYRKRERQRVPAVALSPTPGGISAVWQAQF